MKSPLIRIMIAAAAISVAGPALAQNGVAPAQPPASGTAPAQPPATGTPPGTTPAAPPVVVVPVPAENVTVAAPSAPVQAPPEPVTINPDAAYPNGFADPVDPFANMSEQPRQGGFPWGLLGLLGLLGLIPLFRRGGGRTTRTVYVDRDDPKRVIREEQVEE